MSVRCLLALVVATPIVLSAPAALARDAFSQYGTTWRTATLPPVGAGSFSTTADFLPDGRLVAVTGAHVLLETAPRSGVYDVVGILDPSEIGVGVDPSFLRISPDGSTIAIGAGFLKPVAVVPVASLGVPGAPAPLTSGVAARYYDVPHFEGAWRDNTSLALTAGDFGSPSFVSLLDTTSDAAAPVNPIVVSNIGGASAGVAFDAAGRLYTGNGFDLDPDSGSTTGVIRAFSPDLWSGGPADFESSGILIGELLSAGALLFDLEGNLIVGGGDFPDDAGYLGVVHASALANALAGLGPIDPADPLQLRRLDPLGSGFGYFGSAFDASTGELSITDGRTWYATIPTPATALLITLPLALLTRRRHS